MEEYRRLIAQGKISAPEEPSSVLAQARARLRGQTSTSTQHSRNDTEAITPLPLTSEQSLAASQEERRGSDHEIRTAVNEYVQAEKAQGSNANVDRAVDYVFTGYKRAGRDRVRKMYNDIESKGRGRPKKSRA